MTKKKKSKKKAKSRVPKKKKLLPDYKPVDLNDFLRIYDEIHEEHGGQNPFGPSLDEEGHRKVHKLIRVMELKARKDWRNYVVAPELHSDPRWGSVLYFLIYVPEKQAGRIGPDGEQARDCMKVHHSFMRSGTDYDMYFDPEVAMDVADSLNHARGMRKLRREGPISQECSGGGENRSG